MGGVSGCNFVAASYKKGPPGEGGQTQRRYHMKRGMSMVLEIGKMWCRLCGTECRGRGGSHLADLGVWGCDRAMP